MCATLIPVAAETRESSTDQRLFRLLWLSIAAAVATISLKTVAWLLTGSAVDQWS
jgi:divalent metal cation (Fe/Co/Zn/Cd) transporter